MFKILVLQPLYTLSDDAAEFQIKDRLSFMRFLRLGFHDRVSRARRVKDQRQRQRGRKLYSLHAPEVECIGKGKPTTRTRPSQRPN
jgi:IS5 family transposase